MLRNNLKINSENFEYIEHCIAQQGGLILQATLGEGTKTEPTANPFKPNDRFGGWVKILNSWPEAILDFSVKPKISSKGDSIGYIQHNFDLIYAPSKNIARIGGFGCVGQGLSENSIYIPNAQTLESGLKDCFVGDLENLSPSQKDLYKIVQVSMENLPKHTFTPRDMQIAG